MFLRAVLRRPAPRDCKKDTILPAHLLLFTRPRRMSTSVAILDPTASSQQQWLDVLHSSPNTPTTAVISTNSITNGSQRAGELTDDFYRALSSLHRLPNLTSVALHFGPHCHGAESAAANSATQTLFSGTFESRERRLHVLRAFFEATAAHGRARELDPASPRIRTLTIKNLQNDEEASDALTTSAPFRDTMAHVRALHLHICTEWCEENPWAAPEMQRFWPRLRRDWLAPVAHRLESLTLYSDNVWGVWPRFDSAGLVFPRLESLALGSFAFGLDEQLDWLVSQKTLRRLSLDGCSICSRWEVEDDVYREPEDDLDALISRQLRMIKPFIADDPDGLEWWVLGYDGTWPQYFARIARELPELRDFRFSSRWCPKGDAPGGSMPDRRADVVFDAREGLGTPAVNAETDTRYVCYSTMNGYEPTVLPDPEGASLTAKELDLEEQRALDDLIRSTRAH